MGGPVRGREHHRRLQGTLPSSEVEGDDGAVGGSTRGEPTQQALDRVAEILRYGHVVVCIGTEYLSTGDRDGP